MSEATRTRTHAPEVRQRAVEILQEGVGHRALAAELGIPQATARQWARAYAVGGADAVLNAGSHHHTYSYDVKLAVVKDRLENGLTVREAMIKHKIPSESSVKAWCRQYRESGESALVDKPRGRKPRVKKRNSKRDGAPTGAHFSCRANFWTSASLSGHPPKWPINRAQWPARLSLRLGERRLSAPMRTDSLPCTPKTPQLTENLPPLFLN